TRGRVPPVSAHPSARLPADISLTRADVRPITDPARVAQNQQIQQLQRSKRDNGLELAVVPAVDRGEIFYQFNDRVYARGLESGLPLPGWATTYAEDASGSGMRPRRFAPASAGGGASMFPFA